MIMRIVRHNSDFTMIDNATLRDDTLSFRATGMLAYLLSMPAEWEPKGHQLTEAKREGRDAVYSTLQELEKIGYLVRSKERTADGTFVHVSTVYERLSDRPKAVPAPIATADSHVLETNTPTPGKPDSGKPNSDTQESYKGSTSKDPSVSSSSGDVVSFVAGKATGSQGESKNGSAKNGSAKAASGPDSFVVTAEMRAWAAEHVRGVDVDGQTEQFVDWWRASGGPGGRAYKDPVAGWRNWLRKSKPGGLAPWRQPDKTNRNPANTYGDEHRVGGGRRFQ